MFQTIFYEKTFTGTGEIQYVTEPFNVSNFIAWRGALDISELNTGCSVEVITQTSQVGNIKHEAEWTNVSNTLRESLGITTFKANNLLSFIRFKIVLRNKQGRVNAKITLSGHAFESSV